MFGGLTVAVISLGNLAAAVNVIVQERFGARTGARLQTELFDGYLAQPYAFHVQRDAPSLMKVMLNDVRSSMIGVVTPALLGIARAAMAVGVLALLFIQNPVLALSMALALGAAYFIVFRIVRARQRRLGVVLNRNNLERHRILQEGFGGVKELQVLGRERSVVERFATVAASAAAAEASNKVTAQLPRYALETIAFGGIVIVTLFLVSGAGGGGASAIPVLALYAFAGYRLMPALQQMFVSAVSIRFSLPTLRGLHADFRLVTSAKSHRASGQENLAPQLHLKEAIRLDGVSFTYEGADRPALRNVNLVIRPNECIGFVGRTGAGKTTLADVILGLYEPTAGELTLDGVALSGPALRTWQRRVGYVPQSVFLANASVAENIALGIPPEEIDRQAVRDAACLAQADHFIDQMVDGIETLVGERGVKLSGGQRQRIGVARALYHKPEILVFDEATSALDGLTEDAVMESIRRLSGQRTVILVAHRLRTVEACDRIIMLEDGRIVADGPYRDLMANSSVFRSLVGRTAGLEAEKAAV